MLNHFISFILQSVETHSSQHTTKSENKIVRLICIEKKLTKNDEINHSLYSNCRNKSNLSKNTKPKS